MFRISSALISSIFRFTLIALAFVFASSAAEAGDTGRTGFVKLDANRSLYVKYQKPAPGQPTIVLLNGLTYRVGSWDPFVDALGGDGLGILRYDPMGHGETLLRYAPITEAIDYRDQVRDLARLLDALQIDGPVHLVGLSYGGALGLQFAIDYPERVANLVLMAPFIAPLQDQDVWIRWQIAQTRIMFPLNPATDDQLYDYFLKQIIYLTYPPAEPIVLENPYKLEATFRLVQGIRKFLAREISDRLPTHKVHLMLGLRDEYLKTVIHDDFWKEVVTSARASRLDMERTAHKIPEASPNVSAAWVKAIALGDSRISNDRTFRVDIRNGVARSGEIAIDLGTTD